MKLKLLSLIFLFNLSHLYSQYLDLSPEAEISILTIGPGNSLNDSFGHSSFRLNDPSLNLDIIFNYGVYDFDAENFYLKFARGKLNYIVDTSNFEGFKNHYIRQNRYIKEQVLNLTQQEKQRAFNFLANNAEPENKYYLYDFFYDNCATKMRDILIDGTGLDVEFNEPKTLTPTTFRKLIQQNLDWNSWGSFGIDVALGSVIDKPAKASEHMFLPEYIHSFFENASIKGNPEKPLVKIDRDIFKNTKSENSNNFFLSPLFILGLLSAIIIYLTYSDFKKNKRTKWLDIILFAMTGLIGVFLLLLWFATDHSATAQNYNLLWAFALNIFVIGQVFKIKPKNWFTRYLKFLVIMLCLLVLQWVAGIQGFAYALIPLLGALALRYIYLIYYYNKYQA